LGAGWPAPGGPWARLRGGRAAPTRPRQAVGATGLGATALRAGRTVVGLPGLEPGTSSLSGFCPRACFRRIAPATCANDLPLETAGDRCEPLGSDGVWTKRGPSTALSEARLIAEPGWRSPLLSSGSGDTGVCLGGDNDAVRGPGDEEELLGFLRRLLGGSQQ